MLPTLTVVAAVPLTKAFIALATPFIFMLNDNTFSSMLPAQEENEPQGVFDFAQFDPAWGIDTMVKNRNGKSGVLLTNGPAKMMQAFWYPQ